MVNVFAVPVFFIVFRESLETAIIAAILLSFLKKTFDTPESDRAAYVRLRRHVWLGLIVGFICVLAIGGGMIGAFYRLGVDAWAKSENLWEGIFCLIASIIITVMGAAILRVSKLQKKWQEKITKALQAPRKETTFGQKLEKYALFILPFITILREGLEAVIFVGGVGLSFPASAFPIPVITGILAGLAIGFIMYKGGNMFHLQIFLIISTCFLYLVAAGLFSRGVWTLEMYEYGKLVGGDVAETGSGPGSYDIRQSVWHVNCCSPGYNGGGGWGIFNALFGWQNSATYGSVISYNVYWIVVIAYFLFMYFREQKEFSASAQSDSDLEADNGKGVVGAGKNAVAVDEKSA
ncbi:hypothetical protein TWF106_004965 [Orbilia oligospora]|uniref:High-affinity iron permease n=1 Tax=Orbilia oligospora TaxID=2813651 RepID=A0A6G1M9H7_ORBOL|nr:hypothetical protein TWF788_009445 [Orbilia oligospora]KAF3196381.1 hypothetical protein TWF106_004965 [Orbilia oligospora]KAF3218464.1 hypothetical protein TWF679_000991 [Orbilia oligospora]KAF3224334.1 hypothetical protein TWF191_006117 [Orbilia oligospora]KAF3249534.1 hypothetical protein TWF192_005607 [Orbilia oligospora]